MPGPFTTGILLHRNANILDRVDSPSQLSQTQSEVDRLVESGIASATDGKTMASFLAAGLAGKFIRLGSVPSGESLALRLLQGLSPVAALAGESAVFTSLERGFTRIEGHAVPGSFQKDWARAALSLGSLKGMGALTATENFLVQHLAADLGLVGAQHLGHIFEITARPEGTFFQQMLQAEAMNLSLKGSQALLYGLCPSLVRMEKALDLYLKNDETDFLSWGSNVFPFSFPIPAGGVNGGISSRDGPQEIKLPLMFEASGKEKKGESDSSADTEEALVELPEEMRENLQSRLKVLRETVNPDLLKALEYVARKTTPSFENFGRIFSIPFDPVQLSELVKAGVLNEEELPEILRMDPEETEKWFQSLFESPEKVTFDDLKAFECALEIALDRFEKIPKNFEKLLSLVFHLSNLTSHPDFRLMRIPSKVISRLANEAKTEHLRKLAEAVRRAESRGEDSTHIMLLFYFITTENPDPAVKEMALRELEGLANEKEESLYALHKISDQWDPEEIWKSLEKSLKARELFKAGELIFLLHSLKRADIGKRLLTHPFPLVRKTTYDAFRRGSPPEDVELLTKFYWDSFEKERLPKDLQSKDHLIVGYAEQLLEMFVQVGIEEAASLRALYLAKRKP